MSDIVTLNGYKIKDEKAVRSYDTIALMKADTKLKEGYHVKTKGYYETNDGGHGEYVIVDDDTLVDDGGLIHVLSNGLRAKLISNKNNVLCYGVTLNDSNSNNHTIIKYVVDTMKKAYCEPEITLKNSLILDTNNTEFTFNKINYIGNSYSILINNNNIKLNGNEIVSSNDGLRLGLSNLTMNCNVNINKIVAENIAILLGGTAGVYYNTLTIDKIDYKTNGVKVLLDDYHVGEIAFYNTGFTDLNDDTTERYAFHCHATDYRATGFKFYNVSLEGAHGGFYFEGTGKLCEYLHIFGLRCTELAFKNYKVLKVKCNQTTIPLYGDIFFDNAKPSSFDFSEYTVTENTSLVLHGAFRNDFNGSNDLLGYEGHPSYTRLVLTKLPRGYDVIRTSDTPQLLQATSIVGLPPSGATTPNTLKLKIGDSDYVYNGHLQIFINNENVTSVDIYANDGTTLVRSIPVSGTTIINAEFSQLFSNQTQLIYSISNTGATSTFN